MTIPSILFYCKECKRVVLDPEKNPKKYEYRCSICHGDRVVFGTKQSICDFFNIKENALEQMLSSPK